MQQEKKYYTVRTDRVFKTVLCNEDDKGLMQEFLSRLLNRNILHIFYKFVKNSIEKTKNML